MKKWLEGFESAQDKCIQELKAHFALILPDEKGTHINQLGYPVGRILNFND